MHAHLANFEVLALLTDQRVLSRDLSENIRTVQLEAIQYLAADFQPTAHQSAPRIAQLVRDLAPFALTKAEKLQVVNLAPTEPVELYVIVEELEDRIGVRMDDILAVVSKSLAPAASAVPARPPEPETIDASEAEQAWEHDTEEVEFDDLGEGAAVEGDLDMEDDS